MGVDLVHQVAGLARVEPLGDHRLVPEVADSKDDAGYAATAARLRVAASVFGS